MSAEHTGTTATHEDKDYTDRDINVMNIAISIVVICVVAISAAVGMLALHKSYAGAYQQARDETPALAKIREIPPGPKLQVNGRAELVEYRKGIERQLENYEYTDKIRGIGRIPIDRAKAIVAEKGLPTRSSH